MSSFAVEFTDVFLKKSKGLRKRNPKFRSDLAEFLEDFAPDAHPIIPGSNGARKARMKVSGRGKSGGYRVVYYTYIGNTIYMITIYDKAQQENLSSGELNNIADFVRGLKNDT